MSSVRSGPFDQKNTTYIVTGASLTNDLVTYTQSLSAALVQTGTFAAHPNAALVTQGFLLVDTGKRLVPGQQPNVPTLLIGVNAIPVDSSGRRVGSFSGANPPTAISGFIDPNSPNVAVYSRDRPTTFNDNLYFAGATNLNNAGALMTNASLMGSSGATIFTESDKGAGVRHRGPGVFSGGALTAGGSTGTSSASITNILATSTLATYTASNAFVPGQTVTVTGLPATVSGSGGSGGGALSYAGSAVPTFAASSVTGTGVITYTIATHVLAVGQVVSITGITGETGYNLTNAVVASVPSGTTFTVNYVGAANLGSATAGVFGTVTTNNLNVVNAIITSASATQFTIRGGFIPIATAAATATAVATTPGVLVEANGLQVRSGSLVANSGLTVSGGLHVERLAVTALTATSGTTATFTNNIDLSLGNIFTQSIGTTSGSACAVTYTLTNSTPGVIFYVVVTNIANSSAVTLILPTNVSVVGAQAVTSSTTGTVTVPVTAAGRIVYQMVVTA